MGNSSETNVQDGGDYGFISDDNDVPFTARFFHGAILWDTSAVRYKFINI